MPTGPYAKVDRYGIKGTQLSGVKLNDSYLYLYGTDKALFTALTSTQMRAAISEIPKEGFIGC